MLNKNIETFIGCDASYEEADMVLFGAPFDSTTSFRPGTRFAPRTMRQDSYGLETYSPYLHRDLEDVKVFDGGDLELCIGDAKITLQQIEEYTKQIVNDQKIPFLLGGEHLVSLGSIRAVANKYPDLHIIHFDAHTDLRDDYLGATLSHATVIRRVWDIVGDDRIYQFGIRSGDRSEFSWAKDHVFTNTFDFNSLDEIVSLLKEKPVYFTLDLDVLDPSIFSGTGTPEAGGVSFMELIKAIVKLSPLNIVGLDMVELSPTYDASGVSTAVACKVIRESILSLLNIKEDISYE